MQEIISTIVAFLLGITGLANLGAPAQQTFHRSLIPIDSTENVGTSTAPWDEGWFNELCLSADCRTSWPAGGGGSGSGLATSSPVSAGDVLYYSATGAGSAKGVATGTISSANSALSVTANRYAVGGALTLTVASTSNNLFSGTAGQVLAFLNGGWTGVATTTFNSPLNYSGGAVTLDTSGTWTGNAGTASALAANGANCSSGNAPLGVDASGAVESCFDVWTEAENTSAAYVQQTRTLTVAGTANQLTSSAGAQDLSANRTWTLSLPSHVIFPGNFFVNNSTTTNATTTSLAILGKLFDVNGSEGTSGQVLSTTGSGVDWIDAPSGGGVWPFTPTTNWGQNVQATTTALWFQASPYSLFASSTLNFDQFYSASTTATSSLLGRLGIGTTTPAKLLTVYGNIAGGIVRFAREAAGVSGTPAPSFFGVQNLAFKDTGSGHDRLGPSQTYEFIDSAGTINTIGQMGFIRDGADNSGSFNLYAYSNGSATQAFTVNGPDGIVAIGSTTPSGSAASCGRYGLCVVGAAANSPSGDGNLSEAQIKVISATSTDEVRAWFNARSNTGSTATFRSELGTETAHPLTLWTASVMHMRIGSAGQVTIDPTGNFTTQDSAGLLVGHNSTAFYDPLIGAAANSTASEETAYPLVLQNYQSTTGSTTGIGFAVTNTGTNVGASILFKRTGTNSKGQLSFFTKQSTTASADPAEVMVLSDAGLVGVATTTPYARLSVNSVAGDTYSFVVGSSTTPWIRTSNSGFGTTTLSGLTVSGSATSTSNVGFNLTGGCFAINGTCVGGSGGGGSPGGTGTEIQYRSGASTFGAINSAYDSSGSGRTGIGTTTMQLPVLTLASTTGPQLGLSAGAGLNQWLLSNTTAGSFTIASTTVSGITPKTTPQFVINGSTGFVGINKASPVAQLDVAPQADGPNSLVVSTSGGGRVFTMGTYPGDSSYAVLWAGNITPSGSNYFMLSDGGEVTFNAPDSGRNLYFRVGGGTYMNLKTSGLAVMNSNSAFANGLSVASNGSFGSSYPNIAAPSNGLIIEGTVGIGTSTPAYKLSVQYASDGNMFQLYDTDGNCLMNPESGAITTTCTSDAKFKKNVRESTFGALAYFRDFDIRDYEVKSNNETKTGVVAQELALKHPELVKDISQVNVEVKKLSEPVIEKSTGRVIQDAVYATTTSTTTAKFVEQPSVWQLVKAIQELDVKVLALEKSKDNAKLGGFGGEVPKTDTTDTLQWLAICVLIIWNVRLSLKKKQ